uniref:Uncharacterized protein n=1 Tax=Magallana gigas TaxID=29159 RepID=K1QF32_MAGGI
MYEQIAKALWQLQMKGDINKALQNTDIWNRPTQNNSPRSLPRNLNRQGDGLVVRELVLDNNISPTNIRVRTTNDPSSILGPTHVQPSTTKEKQTAFARRATERQITLQAPTIAQTEQATIAPERVYSNKMDRNKVKGYGSSLTKLIANKIKFDPTPGPALPSNPVIDSILGPLLNERGNELPSNFLPLPSTTSGVVPNTGSSQRTTVQIKEKQRTVLAKPVKSTPVVVFPENGGQQVPSPSFSIVAPSLGQNPASFRFSNKEVSSNQLQDKNNKGQNPGFDNFKDMELNDVSQVIVDQAASVSVKPDNVRKPEIVKEQQQKKENNKVDPKTIINPPQHDNTNKVQVSGSEIAMDNIPSNKQRAWQESSIRNNEIQRPDVQVVQSALPALSETSQDAHTTPQTNDTTDAQTDVTKAAPKSTMTESPVHVGISRGSPRGSRPVSSSVTRGSFSGVRPSARGTPTVGRGTQPGGRGSFSPSRGSPRGGRPIGIRRKVLPALSGTSEDVHTTPQTTDTTNAQTDLPVQDVDFTTEVPSSTMSITQAATTTTTTKSPVHIGSSRGGRPIGIRRQEPVNIPEVGQTTPATITETDMTTTQATTTAKAAETEPTTTEQAPQVPAMNTAQFARRARPSRVVVNTLGNTKQRPVVARGVGQARAAIVQPVMIPVPSEILSFDRPAVEQPARVEQIPIVLNSVAVDQPAIDVQTLLVLNSEVAAENDWSLSSSTSATTTEQPPTTAAPATTPAPTTPVPTTIAAGARRPQSIRPGS